MSRRDAGPANLVDSDATIDAGLDFDRTGGEVQLFKRLETEFHDRDHSPWLCSAAAVTMTKCCRPNARPVSA
jgi:hypothetical protein